MKILYCNYLHVDYGMDTLFDGLCRVLGSENVFDYPQKKSLHGGGSCIFWKYPCQFEYPYTASDGEKMQMLEEDKFDAIFVGAGGRKDFRTNHRIPTTPEVEESFNLIKEKSKKIPTYIIDYGDDPNVNHSLASSLNCRLYFKREYLKDIDYEPWVTPLSFSYSEKYLDKIQDIPKENDFFLSGAETDRRKPYFEALKKAYNFIPEGYLYQKLYSNSLSRSKIGINLKGNGNDTVRYYEIPAHNALLLSQKLDIVIENEFTDGTTALFFDSPDEMLDKLGWCLKNNVENIAKAGHAWLRKYHTTEVRARQVLNKIKP